MSNTENSANVQSHGKLIAVVVAAAVVIIVAVLSAFVWPGWAIKSDPATPTSDTAKTENSKTKEEPNTPSIQATALPDDATDLLKAMPDSVLNYARVKAEDSTAWQSAAPLEEYTLVYAASANSADVTLVAGQWSTSDDAKTQYDALAGQMSGKELASGNVKVNGNAVGTYVVKADASDDSKAVALWQNDTVVFQATGTTEAVQRFYQQFPM